MSQCVKCRSALPDDAAFCPRCGHRVAVATAEVPAKAKHRAPWWIVPAVIVGIVAIAWLVLAGLPFGGDDRREITTTRATETIAEGTSSRDAGTVLDVPAQGMDDEPDVPTTTTIAPPTATAIPPMTSTITPPPPTTTTIAPPPVRIEPPPAAPPPSSSRTITDQEAANELRGYITSRNYYGVASECVRLQSRGYRNEGYAFEVWHSCAGGGTSRLLGRWRVDARTREVFRQNDDGRYMRP